MSFSFKLNIFTFLVFVGCGVKGPPSSPRDTHLRAWEQQYLEIPQIVVKKEKLDISLQQYQGKRDNLIIIGKTLDVNNKKTSFDCNVAMSAVRESELVKKQFENALNSYIKFKEDHIYPSKDSTEISHYQKYDSRYITELNSDNTVVYQKMIARISKKCRK